MTATATGSGLRHYRSTLYPFQAEDIALAYLRPVNYAVWDCGTGKTHLAMALAALKFEDEAIDLCIVCCERNKIDATEWPADFATFTDLSTVVYHGDKDRRDKIRSQPLPQVLISTYETMKLDLTVREEYKVRGKKKIRMSPGPLLDLIKNLRVLVVYDEAAAKLKNRGVQTYEAHMLMMKTLRKFGNVEVLNLSATPMDRGAEDVFNAMRIIDPGRAGTVARFDEDYAVRDYFGNIVKYKNLDEDTREDPGVELFQDRFAPILLRRRKTDPELIDYFPKRVEEFVHLRMGERQDSFYETVHEIYQDDEKMSFGLYVIQRQIAADPRTLLLGNGKIPTEIVQAVGEAGILSIGSAKTDAILDHLNRVAKGQGAQVIVFSFFASYLHWLLHDLQEHDYRVALHHGAMGDAERQRAKEDFRGGVKQIFLTSDAGSRGLNLPGALYSVQAELPLTHSLYVQRMDRNHRIDSTFPSVTNTSFVVLESVEEGIEILGHKRNVWTDKILDDEDAGEHFISAEHRKMLSRISRKNPIERAS